MPYVTILAACVLKGPGTLYDPAEVYGLVELVPTWMNGRYVVLGNQPPEIQERGHTTAQHVPSPNVVIGIYILWVIWYI